MNLKITGDFDEKLSIRFSQGTWNVVSHLLFKKLKNQKVKFPDEPSIFRLNIAYDNENYYFETLLYISNPNNDNLSFHFYKEAQKVFCNISSEVVIEANKTIVLGPLPEKLRNTLKNIEEFTS